LYGLFGYQLIEAMYQSESIAIVNQIMAGRSTTPLEHYLREADTLMVVGTFRVLVVIIFLALCMDGLLMPLYACTSVLLFVLFTVAVIEVYPPLADLLHLDAVDYYSYKKVFTPDDVLVYKSKPFLEASIHESFDPRHYGVYAPRTPSDWTTDEEGFRNGRSTKFSDIVIVGDGMINSGRTLEETFSKRLEHHLHGVSVRNLGISGHGPFQYIQVLQTYGIKRSPRVAIFGFNEGNDIQDVGKYLQWRSGVSNSFTGGYEPGITAPILKLTTAYSQTLKHLQDESWLLAETVLRKALGHHTHLQSLAENLATVRLPSNLTFRIAFIDIAGPQSSDEIQKTENWNELRRLFLKFKNLCVEDGVVPIILFIPTAAHIYAEYSTDQSGVNWLRTRNQQIRAKNNLENAVVQLSRDLNIKYVSLTPAFEAAAKNGLQLFDSFSVHMTLQGTEVAGAYVARTLQDSVAGPIRSKKREQSIEGQLRPITVSSVRAY
jgi:hypothetical protein